MAKVTLDYFTDTLCVWAYVAQIRLDELKQKFGDDLEVNEHFITLFGNTEKRIAQGWKDRGGFEGFNHHVLHVGKQFNHLSINPDVWKTVTPHSSANSHLFLKAVQLLVQESHVSNTAFTQLIWNVREAFFLHAHDISKLSVLFSLAQSLGIDESKVREKLENGSAIAALCADNELREQFKLEGSPTYLLNNGRQKLYGNVGFRILEANIQELLERPEGIASWC